MSVQIRSLSAALAAGVTVAAAAAPPILQSMPSHPIQPVPLERVRVTGGFWAQKLETNRAVTIPHIFAQNEQTGRVDNFRKGAGRLAGEYVGRRFNDTDVYKVIEAAAYTLVAYPDEKLAAKLDELIAVIAASQQADGYLFPARTIDPSQPAAGVGTERWMHENTGSHELYNSGHLYEAAIAHAGATGKRTLLDVAVRNAELVRRTFGPTARRDAPGHQEIEIALIRLAQTTGDRRYFDLAKFFIDERGRPHASKDYPADSNFAIYNDRPYRQDHLPVVDQPRAVGHAVRATYLYAAMADVAGMMRDPAYDRAVDRLWQDVVSKRIYVTGGMGARGTVEAFGDDYELPNRTAYTETCASVGGILWHHRMFLKSGAAKYLDALEQTLYNGLLSGVSVSGDAFFYQNPLESTGRAARSPYFDVACCPANLARLVAQLPALVYAVRGRDVYAGLYASTDASIRVGEAVVRVRQTTNYPWDGAIRFDVSSDRPVEFTLKARMPSWLGAAPFASDLYSYSGEVRDAVRYTRGTQAGQTTPQEGWLDIPVTLTAAMVTQKAAVPIRLILPMPIRRIQPHTAIAATAGKIALQRGPIVYAFEGIDNGGTVLDLVFSPDTTLATTFRQDLLGGVSVVTATRPAAAGVPARTATAVPYYAWANRGRGEMVLWINMKGSEGVEGH